MTQKHSKRIFLMNKPLLENFVKSTLEKWPKKIESCLTNLSREFKNSSLLPNISWLYNQGWLQVLFLSSTMGTKKFFLPQTKIEDNHYFS